MHFGADSDIYMDKKNQFSFETLMTLIMHKHQIL